MKYMTGAALAKAGDLLDGSAIDAVASWADEYRHDHRETGPWHYIDIPPANSRIDLARECPNGDCVIACLGCLAAASLPHNSPCLQVGSSPTSCGCTPFSSGAAKATNSGGSMCGIS
jgi:hypothetical protein